MRPNVNRGVFCEPIRVRLQCHPRRCVPSTYGNVFKRCFKSILIITMISILTPVVFHKWTKKPSHHTNFSNFNNNYQKNLGDMERSLFKKLERVDESTAIRALVGQINELQDNVKNMHTQLLALETNLKIVSDRNLSEGPKQMNMVDDATLKLLKEEITLINLDKTGKPDYALASSGGSILSVRDTNTYAGNSVSISMFGIPFLGKNSDPVAVIQQNMSPGDCWAFEGENGTVVIELMQEIYVTHVTLEHLPKQISPNLRIDSAPKKFDLLGLKKIDDDNPFLFGTFQYDSEGTSTQTFPVTFQSKTSFRIIELTVKSNHGHPNFTCIYRIRIHGHPKNDC